MGDFVNKVRRSEIRQPIQRGFSQTKWTNCFSSIVNPDADDKNLHKAGLWYFAMLESVRKELGKYDLSDLKQNERIHLMVAYINFAHNSMSHTKLNVQERDQIYVEDLSQAKYRINEQGDTATPDNIITQYLDAARHPLSSAIKEKTTSSSNQKDKPLTENLEGAMMIGQIYDVIADCWGETLWNNWRLKRTENTTIITPPSSMQTIEGAVSNHRMQLLYVQESLRICHHWQKTFTKIEKHLIGKYFEINIKRNAKRKCYQLKRTNPPTGTPSSRILLRMMTYEAYFQGFRHDPMTNAGGASLEQLLDVWDILYELCKYFVSKLPNVEEISKVNTLKRFAPLVERRALINLINSNIEGLSLSMSEQVIEFLSFHGSKSDELWSAPIVPIDSKHLALVFPSITIGNLRRNCETWLKRAGVDLQKKGPAFETHVRDSISESLSGSSIIKNYGIFPKDLLFEAKGKQEQIDCVFWIGNTILIGEVKCLHLPTEAIERHNYYKTLDSAVSQIKRKTSFIKENIDLFTNKLNLNQPPERIIPFVLTNQPLGVGFAREGIAITDLISLTCYLGWGCIKKRGYSKNFTGIIEDVPVLKFYNTEKEAELKIHDYLLFSPLIKQYADSVKTSLIEWPINDPFGYKTSIIRAEVNYVEEQKLSYQD